MKGTSWVVLGLWAAGSLTACGDDDDSAGDGDADADGDGDGDGDGDADGDGDGDADGDSVSFRLVDTLTDLPIDGATFAVDLPGRARTELVAGADGVVTVTGIDWTAGPMSVTGHAPGYAMHSVLGFGEEDLDPSFFIDGAVQLPVSPIGAAAPERLSVRGTAANLLDDAHAYGVNVVRSLVGSEWRGNSQSSFAVDAPSGAPFTLQALELDLPTEVPSGQGYDMPIYRVMHRDFDASTDDLTDVVLDFQADEVSTSTADVTIALPARPESPIRTANPACFVFDPGSLAAIGWATHLDVSEDGNRFEASLLWTEPAWAEGAYTFCRTAQDLGGGALFSWTSADGFPQAGELPALPDVPAWVVPADTFEARPMHDPLEWELFEDDVNLVGLAVLDRDGEVTWMMGIPATTTTATIPDPPSSVDPVAQFGTDSEELEAFLLAGEWSASRKLWIRAGRGESVYLLP